MATKAASPCASGTERLITFKCAHLQLSLLCSSSGNQLDIYGELMDCIVRVQLACYLACSDLLQYLGQKYGRPLSYDTWIAVRGL